MGNNTTLTPDNVRSVARDHTNAADEITSDQRTLAGNIQTLVTTNRGAMMTKLTTVHGEWDKSTTDIVTNLRTMATTLSGVATSLESQDSENASNVNL